MREAGGQEKPQSPRDLPPPGLTERHVSGLSVCYLPRSAIFQAKNPDRVPESEGMQRLEDERRWLSVPKVYVLQPWILNLLMKYEQLDSRNTQVPGHILKVVNDLKAADQGSAAVLHISDGSYYIRVVVSPEAVQMAECVQLQSGFSNIVGRIIILQKYMVCFQEETKAEECEFYLSVHQFIVLPLQRQRMEALNCNQEPSILQKIKELWQRGLTLKTLSSSGMSVSQLMIDIGQRRLKVLKQNVEDCLDLLDPSEVPAIGERLPVTSWEVERKRELSKDVFTVPVNFLVIGPEEKAAIRDACLAGAPHTVPGRSHLDRDLADCSVVSCPSDPGAMSRSLDVSLDNPWDKLQSVSVTLSSSLEEKSIIQPSLPSTQEAQLPNSTEEVAITQPDSNTPDFLEPSCQQSPCSLAQDEPAETVSPSLLSFSSTCPPEAASQGTAAATFQRAPDVGKHPDASHDIPCGQPSAAFQTNLCPCSPALPILGSINSRAAPPANGGQADLGGAASLPDVENSSLASSEWDTELGGGAGGKDLSRSRQHRVTKRKLLVDDSKAHGEVLPNPGKTHQRAQRKPPHADVPMGDERCMDANVVGQNPGVELVSAQRAKKSRLEQAGPAQEPALPRDPEGLPGRGNERAAVGSVAASGSGQHRAQEQKYVKTTPLQYTYKAPTPDLCARVNSTRISKAMLRWACWVITKAEQP
ncbi:adrenocortical dysplasia protein homolog isoform X1 [Mauremys reevesii]|uniref:adrenocortical dysplasia protein homolog isoform X1 n=2 Tax=Mauremys reevesii TaxID=260615 RepID=UPI00193F47F1|nr:adrenocortical dysplasia protein homolog isoform X1 [Mauremys reevesii]